MKIEIQIVEHPDGLRVTQAGGPQAGTDLEWAAVNYLIGVIKDALPGLAQTTGGAPPVDLTGTIHDVNQKN